MCSDANMTRVTVDSTDNLLAGDDTAALRELPMRLARAGYGEYYASFNPLAPRLHNWMAHCHEASDHLRPLIELFLLALPVARASIAKTLGDLIEPLCRLGLLVDDRTDGYLTTPGLVLHPVLNLWLFCQKPQINPTLYFGDDSMALLTRLRPQLGGRCLDLCAGPGIQALHCSFLSSSVTAVEINPLAAGLAQVNIAMNGRESVVRVYCGNLYEPVVGHVFDTVVANPPLLPCPDHITYPFVGHGGPDGLKITWRILRGLPAFLAPGGIAQLIGTCLSDGILPLCTDALAAWADEEGMDILMTVTAHHPLSPGSPFFEGLVFTAATAGGLDKAQVISAYKELMISQRASHLCAYFLHVTHGTGKLQLQDLAPEYSTGLWYV